MVHALKQARRVLKPNGLLLDLRPRPGHRQVGLVQAGRWQRVGAMQESFDDDRAANAAVAQVVREGWLKRTSKSAFELERSMDTLADLREWVHEFVKLTGGPSHDWLIERVARALAKKQGRTQIAVRGPLGLNVLRKVG